MLQDADYEASAKQSWKLVRQQGIASANPKATGGHEYQYELSAKEVIDGFHMQFIALA